MTVEPESLFRDYRRSGDPAALAATFAVVAPELLRVAAFLLPRDEVEDAVHDTFVVAITRKDAWDEQQALLPWLLGVLANEARGRRRRRRRPPPASTTVSPPPDPVATAQIAEFRDGLERSLRELSRDDENLLRLHLCDELSCREIGDRLQRPAGTVRTQVSRAMSELRRRLPLTLSAPAPLWTFDAAMLDRLRERVLQSANAPAAPSTVAVLSSKPRLGLVTWSAVATLLCLVVASWLAGVFDRRPALPRERPSADAAQPDTTAAGTPEAPKTAVNQPPPPLRRDTALPAPTPVAPWVLRGRVHDDNGRGIADAVIALRHGEFEPRIAVARSAANGDYALDLAYWRDRPAVERSDFFVMVHAKGHHSTPYFGKLPRNARPDTELTLPADFELGPYPTISGRVVDPAGRPVPALVAADDPEDDGRSHGIAHAETDGTFLLVVAGLDEGKVAVRASHPAGVALAATVQVHPGLDTDLGTIVMLPGYDVYGQVVLRDGTPLADCEVSVHTQGGTGGSSDVRTDRDGRFHYVRPLPNAWSATLMHVSTKRGGTWGPQFDFTAATSTARLEVDAALLELRWLDPEGTQLSPQRGSANVFVDGAADVFAQQGGRLAWLLVPPHSRVRIHATAPDACVATHELTAPAGGRQRVDVAFRRLPRARLRVDLAWDDGQPLAAFDCHVSGVEAGQASAEQTASGPGSCEWLAPIGPVSIHARGYPGQFDGGDVEQTATVPADGSGVVKLTIPRLGRIALTLRDIAAGDRIDDAFAADVVVGGEELAHFVFTEGDTETTSSEPPLGRRLETLQLLPPGTHEVMVTADGWLPAKTTVDVRADQVRDIVVWLQRR